MVGGFYVPDGMSNCQVFGADTTASKPSTVTSGAAGVKGSYAQVTASTSFDATGLMISSNGNFSGNVACLDVAIGAAAAEQIIIPNHASITVNAAIGQCVYYPVSIPAGTRISVRSQSTASADAIPYIIYLFDNAAMGRSGGIIDQFGFVSANTNGTAVDCGAAANTKGAYTQLTAATTVDYSGFCFHLDSQNTAYASLQSVLIDIAVGAASSEQVILPNYAAKLLTNGSVQPIWSPWLSIPIRSGSRIAVRGQCSSATLALRQFGIIFYGLR